MPANVGGQNISLRYQAPGNSAEINERFVNIRPVGIYSGGYLTVVDGTHASVSPLVCEIGDGTHQIRVETTVAVSIAVAAATPYIVLRWAYAGTTSDYMEILAVSSANVGTNDLVVGKCTFAAAVLNGFTYGDSTYPRTHPNTQALWLKVIPRGSSSLKMWVQPGYYQSHDASVFVPLQETDSLVPPTTNSKVYLVYINTAGAVAIDSSGTEAASPVAPDYDGRLVLAEVTLDSTATEVTASDIKDVRPFVTHGRQSIDGTTITVDSDGKLKVADPSYLVLQDDNDQASLKTTWTKLTFDNEVKASGISQSGGVVTLIAGKLYKIAYQIVFEGTGSSFYMWGESRIRVLSGDISWELKDDSDNVSYSKFKMGLAGYPTIASLSGQCILLPASTTTLQLEVVTKSGVSFAKVIRCSLNVWT